MVRAEQHLFALGDIGKTLGEVLLNGGLYFAFRHHLVHTALLLDGEELFPCLGGNGVGEVLQIERTCRRVHYLVEMRFLFEQKLLVAGNTLGKVGRLLEGNIERRNDNLIDTCNGSRHSLRLRAQQVDIGIENSHIETARFGTDIHLGRLFEGSGEYGCLVGLDNLCPQQTGGTELGNLHKVVATDTHIETNDVSGFVVRHASLGEHGHIVGTPRQCIRQLLCAVGTGVVEYHGVNSYNTIAGQRLGGFDYGCNLGGYYLTGKQFAFEEHIPNGVNIDRALHVLHIIPHTPIVANQDVRQLGSRTRTNGEVDSDSIGLDIVEQVLDKTIVEFLFVETEPERGDAFVQYFEGFGVGFACILAGADILPNSPFVVGLGTTHIREFTRCGNGCFESFEVFAPIKRLYIEALGSAPY